MGGLPGCQEGVGLICAWFFLLHGRVRCIGKCCEDTGVGLLLIRKNGDGRSWSTTVSMLRGSGVQVGDGGLNHMGMRSR